MEVTFPHIAIPSSSKVTYDPKLTPLIPHCGVVRIVFIQKLSGQKIAFSGHQRTKRNHLKGSYLGFLDHN